MSKNTQNHSKNIIYEYPLTVENLIDQGYPEATAKKHPSLSPGFSEKDLKDQGYSDSAAAKHPALQNSIASEIIESSTPATTSEVSADPAVRAAFMVGAEAMKMALEKEYGADVIAGLRSTIPGTPVGLEVTTDPSGVVMPPAAIEAHQAEISLGERADSR